MLLGMSDLLEVVVIMKVVWRFAVRECGVQSVMICGLLLMPMLCVASLDFLTKVIKCRQPGSNKNIDFQYIHEQSSQVLLQGVEPSSAKVVEVSCLIMWAVLELRPDSLIAPTMALVSTTVSTLKMLEPLVKL